MLLLNISTVLILLGGAFLAGLATAPACRVYRAAKAKRQQVPNETPAPPAPPEPPAP